jgi:hypothetical protein
LLGFAVPQFEFVEQNLACARDGKLPASGLLDTFAGLGQSRGRVVSELFEKGLFLGRGEGALASPMTVFQQDFDTTLAPLACPKGLA